MTRFAIIITVVALLAGCVSDPTMESIQETTPTSKIVNPNATPAQGFLLVRLTEEMEPTFISEIAGVEMDIEPLFSPSTRAKSSTLDGWYLLSFDKGADVENIAQIIAEDNRIEKIEYDVKYQRPRTFNAGIPTEHPEPTRSVEFPFDDPELPWQWHYYNDGSLSDDAIAGADINLLNAWKYTAGDNRVIVAVIDGGIMADHRDLADNMWVNEAEKNGLTGIDDDGNGYVDDIHGINCVKMNGNITPDAHGTHVAGTIAAVNNNGFAVCGIAGGTGNGDGVRLMSIQIFDGEESCYTHQIVKGFEYAAENGAVIANNSWGYPNSPDAYKNDSEYEKWDGIMQQAIDYFKEEAKLDGVLDGGLAIFAAGNESTGYANYPGAYNRNLCVAAMAPNYTPAFYSNYGPGTNISAPGGDATYGTIMAVSSTSVEYAYSYGYEYMHGTSMATPHVSGCAALALSYALKRGYEFSVDEFRNLILTSVQDINSYMSGSRYYFDHSTGAYETIYLSGYKNKMGTGYIDAHKLLMQMDGTPCIYLRTGEQTLISLENYFGKGYKTLKYENIEVSNDVIASLGLGRPSIENGMLNIECTKPGVGRIKIRAIAGGDTVGGGDNIGGMLMEREFEVVVRGSVATNGGWL
ncbi:MAG: S8 family serine peptidase [Alistipes sp.]|nr:S8 family serine peptidase [Alistipes sp.]